MISLSRAPGMNTESIDTQAFALLRTKLHQPQVSADSIPRPRLIERLNVGLDLRLTLVCAPAGFGKTTLLAQWLADIAPSTSFTRSQLSGTGSRGAWLSLDENDNDLALFLSYVVAAIQSLFPESCPETAGLLAAAQLPPQDTLVALLINEISDLPKRVVLVLDDYHRIADRAVHRLVEALVRVRLDRLHLVLSSRTEPLLSLARLRLGGQVSEIRADDLRFTAEEAGAFLQATIGPRLTDEATSLLEEHTEGWIAGLRLAAISIDRVDDIPGFVHSFRGAHRDLVVCWPEMNIRSETSGSGWTILLGYSG
jgi:LuxR family maltose regulon positive regulatory protein